MKRSWWIQIGLSVSLLAGCASELEKTPATTAHDLRMVKPVQPQSPALSQPAAVGGYWAATLTGDYAGYPALQAFIETMVQKQGFDRHYLYGLFSQAKRKQWTLDYLHKSDQSLKAKPGPGSWTRYRAKFLDERHIKTGANFWRQYNAVLQRASQQYGVPAEYILGIMAVETTFGSFVGNHRVIDALTTLGFDYQRRGEYFRSELEKFLLMTRSEQMDPGKPVGSFAGAMGLGQFMPSSFMEWAVDFNGDGRKDLWNPEDSIGSIAHYFAKHGWQGGQGVVSPIRGNLAAASQLEPGLDKLYSLDSLTQAGLSPVFPCQCDAPLRLLWLRHADHDEYRIGYPNFYVITRYNQSTHYAMAVHELAQAIKQATAS